jgi:hypothetical protein
MYPNKEQFGARFTEAGRVPIKREVRRNYPQLMEELNLQLKQAKVIAQTCYPWQLTCETEGGGS